MSDSDPENLPDADAAAVQSTPENETESLPEACAQKPLPRLGDDLDSDGAGFARDLFASDEARRAEGSRPQWRSEGTDGVREVTDSRSRERTRTATGTRSGTGTMSGSGTGTRSRARTGSGTRTRTGTRSGTADRDGGAQIILALVLQRNNIGVAVFNEMESILLWQQVATDKEFSVLRRIRAHIDPSFIVLPAPLKNNDAFMIALEPEITVESPHPTSSSSTAPHSQLPEGFSDFEFVPGSEWSPGKAAQNICLLSLETMPERLSPSEKRAYMTHLLPPDCEAAFRAVGGLISVILTHRLVNSLERADHPIPITQFCQADFAEAMFMSANTQRALQVFQLDPHPLGHGSGKAKEGLSLFGVLGRTKSAVGSKLLQTWIAAPSTNIAVIQERQNLIGLLRASQFSDIFSTLCGSLGKVKNIPAILTNLQAVEAKLGDWQGLLISGQAFLSMHEALRAFHAAEPLLSDTSVYEKFLEMDAGLIRDSVKWIDSVIDFPGSKIEGSISIKEGFSADIDSIRACYAGLDEFLTTVGVQEMKRIGEETPLKIPSLQIVYLPQAGFMMLLAHTFLNSSAATDELLRAGGLEFQFNSPQEGGYFKNEQCYILDDELGDIAGALKDLEAKAVRYLETKVLPAAQAFHLATQVAAELDCLVALATVANESDWVKPVFDDSSHELIIVNGRHALQELVLDNAFIPNSFSCRGGGVHLITGPNGSGKSVFCKQVALIVILAHIGSAVPADFCTLGIIDAIYTRLASNESISLNQSSFFIDASQVANVLHHAGERSLVLLDEWGKGTDDVDGMALFAATLREILKRPMDRAPCVLAATHFTELVANPFLPMSNERLSTYSMDVVIEKENVGGAATSDPLDAKIVYLFRIVPGSLAGESRAINSAKVAGVPREVLVRSIEVRSAIQNVSTLYPPSQNTGGMPRMTEITWAVRSFMDADFNDENMNIRSFLASLRL